MSARFVERVALITGGARGQGRSHALAFAREGADIVLNDICENIPTVPTPMATLEQLNETAGEIERLGRRVLPVKADVSKSHQVKPMVDRAVSEFGKIDILVNNHGIANVVFAYEMTEEQWKTMIDVNLNGVWITCMHVISHMIRRKYGKIVNTSSGLGLVAGYPGMIHYAAAKHGVVGLTMA